MSDATIHTLAKHVSGLFTNGTRRMDDGHSREEERPFIRILPHEGEPGFEQWIQDMCFEAHKDDGGDTMLPDDWKYRMVERACDIIAETDSEEAAQDRLAEEEPPIYNSELLAWLSSHTYRTSYADTAAEELGLEPPRMRPSGIRTEGNDGILRRCAVGYLYELAMVFDSVLESLKARAAELETEAPAEA